MAGICRAQSKANLRTVLGASPRRSWGGKAEKHQRNTNETPREHQENTKRTPREHQENTKRIRWQRLSNARVTPMQRPGNALGTGWMHGGDGGSPGGKDTRGCFEAGCCQPKSEGRKPKAERSPKPEIRKRFRPLTGLAASAAGFSGLRISDFRAAGAAVTAIGRTLEQP